jgi:hypothetical protein
MTQRHGATSGAASAHPYRHPIAAIASASLTLAWIRARLTAAVERLLRSSVRPPATTILQIQGKLHDFSGVPAARPELESYRTMTLGDIPAAPAFAVSRQDQPETPRASLRAPERGLGQFHALLDEATARGSGGSPKRSRRHKPARRPPNSRR